MINLLTEHLDIWATAQTPKAKGGRGRGKKSNQSPHGIKKLRELILELAVRGKLVPQDPNDEPACVLLEKIAQEKARLIKEGRIKKQKKLPEISEEEKPFGLPVGWEWARLGNIGYTQTGGTPSKSNKSFFGNDIPFIKPGDIYPAYADYLNEGLSFAGQKALGRMAPKGSILMVCIGTIGKCCSIDRDCSFNQQINSLSPYVNVTDFLLATLRSNYFQTVAWEKSSSTTIAILNKGKWADIFVPLAPLAEQQRIVTNVDELMALCDQLERQQTDSNATHQTLLETLLATLTNAADQEEFAKAWQRIVHHFDTLFTTEQSIDQLKQTILQLAVMGKLVPQNPDDEPASVLLKKIAKEKVRLIKEGKIKKQKSLPEISKDEKPFKLSDGWEWSRLQEVLDVRDGTHDSPKDAIGSDTYPLVTSKNFFNGIIKFDEARRISAEDHFNISKRSFVERYDILFSMIGGNLGNQVLVDGERPFSVKNVALFKYYDKELTVPFFMKKFMEYLALTLQSKAAGGAQPFVSLGFLRGIVIAIPPVAEQKRIVTKVDELMALCDNLKARLNDAQTTQVQLADAIIGQAVE